MATHPGILPWEILWTEEPCWLQSMGSQNSWTQLSDYATIKECISNCRKCICTIQLCVVFTYLCNVFITDLQEEIVNMTNLDEMSWRLIFRVLFHIWLEQ